MVKFAAQFLLLAALAALPVSAADPAKALANYRLGEAVSEDIVTPMPLTVVDADATESLRQQEIPRIPLIYRFSPRFADESDTAFRKVFAATRESFLSALEKTFNTRQLNQPTIDSPPFQELAANFQKENDGFPANLRLLNNWARGASDEVLEGTLTGRLRDAMSRYIRPEGLPAGVKSSAHARVVAAPAGEPLTLETVDRQHDDVARGNMPTLARARADLEASFSAEEQAAAKFLSGFLKENCLFEAELTRQFRTRQTEALLAANNYAAGQLIIRRGQIVTTKTKAALDQLREKMRLSQLQQDATEGQTQNLIFGERTRWLIVALAAVVLTSGFAIWRLTAMRKRISPKSKNNSQLPMKIVGAESDGMVIACPTCEEHIAVPFADADPAVVHDCNHDHASPEQWKQRALAAERRAEQAAAMVRAGLLTQIAQNITGDVVQKLIDQRDHLADVQHQAANQVEAIEGRLEKTEADWQNWRQSYEQRIAELERELANSNEMNRTLIRTKIATARQQLASAEAAHKRTNWN